MQARKLWKAGFAVFFMVAVLGAVLLLISQVPLTGEYYDVVDTHSFSVGEPLTFPWTSEAGVKYRFELKGVDWTSQPRYSHHLSLREDTYLSSRDDEPAEPPWVWYVSVSKWAIPMTVNATFWHYEYDYQVIDRATTSASVEISQSRETTYRPAYLIYVGLPLLIIGAILTTIIGKDADSRMGFAVFQYGWARLRAECKRARATVGGILIFVTALICLFLAVAWAIWPRLGGLVFGASLQDPMKLFVGGPGILAFALGCIAGTMSMLRRHFRLAVTCGAFSLIPAFWAVFFTLFILGTGSKFMSSIGSNWQYVLVGALAPAVVGLVLVATSWKEFS